MVILLGNLPTKLNIRKRGAQKIWKGAIKVVSERVLDVSDLETKTKEELIALAQSMGIENGASFADHRREDVISRIVRNYPDQQALMGSGILDTMNDGYGFLRQNGLKPGRGDIYVSQSQVRRFGLRIGDTVSGQVRAP